MSQTVGPIEVVGVVGAGTMGSGIAQIAAMAEYDVILRDLTEELLAEAREHIEDSLDRFVENERLTDAERVATLDRLETTTEMGALSRADFVIEAVAERMDVKRSVFEELTSLTESHVILATNTSTLSITELGAVSDRPDRVIGLHFMNPPQLMAGVEVVVGEKTAEETVALAHDFAESLGKEPWVSDDRPGFVVNRILMPWINEAIRAHDEGIASMEDIDRAMELGTNVPMGPFELADHIGLDICLAALETLESDLGERFVPAYALRRKVAAGDLGRKTGRGFYDYSE